MLHKRHLRLLCYFLFCLATTSVIIGGAFVAASPPSKQQHVFRAAFGSCMDFEKGNQSFWNKLDDDGATKLDAFVGLGDWIYADSIRLSLPFLFPEFVPATLEHLRELWGKQKSVHEYQEFKKRSKARVVGVLSDHDSGVNDASRANSLADPQRRRAVQNLFMDFLDVAPASTSQEGKVRRESRDGFYAFHKFALLSSRLAVCLVLLDWRFHRQAPRGDAVHQEVLGEQQWNWLEYVLEHEEDPAYPVEGIFGAEHRRCALFVIGSDVPVLEDSAPMELWSEYPQERDRLMRVLAAQQRPVVIISGDVHLGMILKEKSINMRMQNDLVEVISSGLTHSLPGWILTPGILDFVSHEPRRVWVRATKNFGRLEVRCVDPDDAASCSTRISIHSAEDGTELASVEPKFLAQPRPQLSKAEQDAISLQPCAYSPLTRLVMWVKRSNKYLNEAPRLTAILFIIYSVGIASVVFFIVLKFFVF